MRQGSCQHRFLVSAPRPVIHAHKGKIITGNLGAKLRQSPSQSPKSTDLHVSSAWKIQVIIGIIGPIICYINYFVPLYIQKKNM